MFSSRHDDTPCDLDPVSAGITADFNDATQPLPGEWTSYEVSCFQHYRAARHDIMSLDAQIAELQRQRNLRQQAADSNITGARCAFERRRQAERAEQERRSAPPRRRDDW